MRTHPSASCVRFSKVGYGSKSCLYQAKRSYKNTIIIVGALLLWPALGQLERKIRGFLSLHLFKYRVIFKESFYGPLRKNPTTLNPQGPNPPTSGVNQALFLVPPYLLNFKYALLTILHGEERKKKLLRRHPHGLTRHCRHCAILAHDEAANHLLFYIIARASKILKRGALE